MNGLEEIVAFAERSRLIDKLPKGGNYQSTVPRLLGSGKSRAEGRFEQQPPALIERLYEYGKLDLQSLGNRANVLIPDSVKAEHLAARKKVEELETSLRNRENWERFAREVLSKLGDEAPGTQGKFAFGGLELIFEAKSLSWFWSVAGAYPLVSKMPHEVEFVCASFADAQKRMKNALVSQDVFLDQLQLAWKIARHKSEKGANVLIRDVAAAYVVAAQNKNFFNKPSKQTFTDFQEAAFVLNLMHSIEAIRKVFDFERATMQQTQLGGRSKDIAYQLPKINGLGTEPFSTIRLRGE